LKISHKPRRIIIPYNSLPRGIAQTLTKKEEEEKEEEEEEEEEEERLLE
jgi:hypothetical protein